MQAKNKLELGSEETWKEREKAGAEHTLLYDACVVQTDLLSKYSRIVFRSVLFSEMH